MLLKRYNVRIGAIDNNCTCDACCDCLNPSFEKEFDCSLLDVFSLLSSCDGVNSWIDEIIDDETKHIIKPARILGIVEEMLNGAKESLLVN